MLLPTDSYLDSATPDFSLINLSNMQGDRISNLTLAIGFDKLTAKVSDGK